MDLHDIITPHQFQFVHDGEQYPLDFLAERLPYDLKDAAMELGRALLARGDIAHEVFSWHPDPLMRHPATRTPVQTAHVLTLQTVKCDVNMRDLMKEKCRLAVQKYAMRVQGMSELEAALVSQRFMDLEGK